MSSYHRGNITILDPDAPNQEYDTYQCVHCNAITVVAHHNDHAPSVNEELWDGNIPRPNSRPKRRRGFCFNCMGPTCGRKECVTRCIPFEAKLEVAEGKRKFWRQMELVKGIVEGV